MSDVSDPAARQRRRPRSRRRGRRDGLQRDHDLPGHPHHRVRPRICLTHSVVPQAVGALACPLSVVRGGTRSQTTEQTVFLHRRLFQVLWSMVMRIPFTLGRSYVNSIFIFVIFAAWAALTVSILVRKLLLIYMCDVKYSFMRCLPQNKGKNIIFRFLHLF